MPQRIQETPTNTFVGGLVTEAGELTFPGNASVDECNCDLKKDGSRRRRLGIEQEGGSLSTEVDATGGSVISTNSWFNVGGAQSVEFEVVQLGKYVWFYEHKSTGSLSNNRVDTTFTSGSEYQLDLTSYERPNTVLGAASAAIHCSSVKGALIVSSPEINTLYITRDLTTGAFTVTEISFRVRDYDWQGDISTYSEDSSGTPSVGRQYDTKNTGWVGTKGDAALTAYAAANSTDYPRLTHPWYSGKDSSNDFSESEWQKVYSGNTLIVNGHYVLDLYSKDRDTASGLTGVTTSTEDARFRVTVGYAGRVFYAGMQGSTDNNGDRVYFSQLLQNDFTKLGELHQTNDPTSEELSDLLDTDGGFLTIPEARDIKMLHVFGPSLYVFAENGVWRINGVDDVFRATAYSVSKVSEDGLFYDSSFVSAAGRPYWWGAGGIFTLSASEAGVIPQNISQTTVQTFWENIGSAERGRVRSGYDKLNRRVMWAYPSTLQTQDNKLNNILLFDETLTAFFPWKFSDQDTNTDYIVGLSTHEGASSSSVTFNVVDSSGDQVTDGSGNNVVVTRDSRDLSSAQVKFLTRDGDTGKLTFSNLTDSEFLDWGEKDYSSYAEAAYDFQGSLELRGNIPYITSFCKTTETSWDPVVRESSLKLSVYWDFKTVPGAASQEVYRKKRAVSDGAYPTTVVVSRVKPRGRGRVARLRWESAEGKDFHLLGWTTIGATNDRV